MGQEGNLPEIKAILRVILPPGIQRTAVHVDVDDVGCRARERYDRKRAGITEEIQDPLASGPCSDQRPAFLHIEEKANILSAAKPEVVAKPRLKRKRGHRKLTKKGARWRAWEVPPLQQQSLTPSSESRQQLFDEKLEPVLLKFAIKNNQRHRIKPVDADELHPLKRLSPAVEETAGFGDISSEVPANFLNETFEAFRQNLPPIGQIHLLRNHTRPRRPENRVRFCTTCS